MSAVSVAPVPATAPYPLTMTHCPGCGLGVFLMRDADLEHVIRCAKA